MPGSIILKRLSDATGEIGQRKDSADTDEKIVRDAILVHSGPDGAPIVFQSGDGEISFDADRIKRVVEQHNAEIEKLAAEYGGMDKMPIGAFPPILDQHEGDSNDRIRGRLNNLLKFEVRDVPKVGKNVACAVTKITFLGADNVKAVNDGRIYHLSIGIDEATDTLGETSTVITPAAPGAMLLSKRKKGETKMSALSKMQAVRAKRMTQLQSANEVLTQLSSKLVKTNETIKLAGRHQEVTRRLGGLMRSKKLTPAEYKNMDTKKLAALTDDVLETVLKTFEAREPVVIPGQRGTTSAADFADMGKSLEKSQVKRLKAETMKDFAKLSGGKKFKLKDGSDGIEEHKDTHELADEHEHKLGAEHEEHKLSDEESEMKHMAKHMSKWEEMSKHLEAGDVEKAKAVCMEMKKSLSQYGGSETKELSEIPEGQAGMEPKDLQAEVDNLNTQMARLAGMVQELMASEKEEGEAMGEVAEEHKQLSEEIQKQKEAK